MSIVPAANHAFTCPACAERFRSQSGRRSTHSIRLSADVPLVNMARDLDRLKQLCPQLVIAKTLLAGHFNTIEVADQVNAMIERFLAVGFGAQHS